MSELVMDMVGAPLARQDLVAVVSDYRIYPEASWTAFVQDSAAVVAWSRRADTVVDPGDIARMAAKASDR